MTFRSLWNMQDIIKMNGTVVGIKKRMINTYFHTLTTCHMHLFIAGVAITYGKFVKFTRDVISTANIYISVGINSIGGGRCGIHLLYWGVTKFLSVVICSVETTKTEEADLTVSCE